MASTKITINTNGSIRIEGDFEIVDPAGKPFGLAGRTVIGLCRCGHSENKPFCDGSHKTTSFRPLRFVVTGAAIILEMAAIFSIGLVLYAVIAFIVGKS